MYHSAVVWNCGLRVSSVVVRFSLSRDVELRLRDKLVGLGLRFQRHNAEVCLLQFFMSVPIRVWIW